MNKIPYELAKELKDAGFPQHPKGDYGTHDCGCTNIYYCTPTLSELIEACGQEFDCLDNLRTEGWAANSRKYRIVRRTPEEAVARLWLALNQPHHD